MNRFGVFDFDQAADIIRIGYEETLKAIDLYEKNLPNK